MRSALRIDINVQCFARKMAVSIDLFANRRDFIADLSQLTFSISSDLLQDCPFLRLQTSEVNDTLASPPKDIPFADARCMSMLLVY